MKGHSEICMHNIPYSTDYEHCVCNFFKVLYVTCIVNCVDPDQLASLKPADQDPH